MFRGGAKSWPSNWGVGFCFVGDIAILIARVGDRIWHVSWDVTCGCNIVTLRGIARRVLRSVAARRVAREGAGGGGRRAVSGDTFPESSVGPTVAGAAVRIPRHQWGRRNAPIHYIICYLVITIATLVSVGVSDYPLVHRADVVGIEHQTNDNKLSSLYFLTSDTFGTWNSRRILSNWQKSLWSAATQAERHPSPAQGSPEGMALGCGRLAEDQPHPGLAKRLTKRGSPSCSEGRLIPVIRLKGFYGTASMVADGRRTGEPWDHLHGRSELCRLHRELARDLTREVLEKLKGKSKGMLNPENRDASIESIHDAVMVLQRELAALDVMIETIQASRDVIH